MNLKSRVKNLEQHVNTPNDGVFFVVEDKEEDRMMITGRKGTVFDGTIEEGRKFRDETGGTFIRFLDPGEVYE